MGWAMVPAAPNGNQSRLQRGIVRHGPLTAGVATTGIVVAKILLLMLDIFGLDVPHNDIAGLSEKLDQISWPIAIFMLLASWMTFFLGVPLWQGYLAFMDRRSVKSEEETGEGPSVIQSSRGARQKRLH